MKFFLYILFTFSFFVPSSFAMKRTGDRDLNSELENKGNLSSKKSKYNQETGRTFYNFSMLVEIRIQELRHKFTSKDEESKREGVNDIKELIVNHAGRIEDVLPLLFPRRENFRRTSASNEFFRSDPYIKSAFLLVRDDKNIPLLTRLRIATAYSLYDPRGCDHFAALLPEIGEDAEIKKEAIELFRKLNLVWAYDESLFKEVCETFLGPLSAEKQ